MVEIFDEEDSGITVASASAHFPDQFEVTIHYRFVDVADRYFASAHGAFAGESIYEIALGFSATTAQTAFSSRVMDLRSYHANSRDRRSCRRPRSGSPLSVSFKCGKGVCGQHAPRALR